MYPLTNSTRLAYSLDSVFRQNGVEIEVSRFDGQRWDREAVKEDKRERERGRKRTSSFGSIEALWAINNAECWAPISQVNSVPARTFYSDWCIRRERESKRGTRLLSGSIFVSLARPWRMGLFGPWWFSQSRPGEEVQRARAYGKTRTGAIMRVSVADVFIIC